MANQMQIFDSYRSQSTQQTVQNGATTDDDNPTIIIEAISDQAEKIVIATNEGHSAQVPSTTAIHHALRDLGEKSTSNNSSRVLDSDILGAPSTGSEFETKSNHSGGCKRHRSPGVNTANHASS
ncbi:MAG: hypothetical protein M1814_001195 [Vezdaea aestivalis]|nr:MAG: hypothetical protein M1814_001195 [Vezdaea aestivalis]